MTGTSLLLVALLPLVSTVTIPLVPDDLFVVVGVLLLGTVAIALLGLDSGTAFGGRVEPSHDDRGTRRTHRPCLGLRPLDPGRLIGPLGDRGCGRRSSPVTVVSPVSLLALVALLTVVVAETGRLPGRQSLDPPRADDGPRSDDPRGVGASTSGGWSSPRGCAWPGCSASSPTSRGVAQTLAPGGLLVAIAAILVKIVIAGVVVAAVEVFLAKVRLFKVPELLAASFVMAFLAVTASYLVI